MLRCSTSRASWGNRSMFTTYFKNICRNTMYCTPWEISQYTKLYLLACGKNLQCFFGRYCEEEEEEEDFDKATRNFIPGTSSPGRADTRNAKAELHGASGMSGIWGREGWSRELERVKVQMGIYKGIKKEKHPDTDGEGRKKKQRTARRKETRKRRRRVVFDGRVIANAEGRKNREREARCEVSGKREGRATSGARGGEALETELCVLLNAGGISYLSFVSARQCGSLHKVGGGEGGDEWRRRRVVGLFFSASSSFSRIDLYSFLTSPRVFSMSARGAGTTFQKRDIRTSHTSRAIGELFFFFKSCRFMSSNFRLGRKGNFYINIP